MEKLHNDDLSLTVGTNLKSLRIQSGLTMEGICFALTISISYALMIERGTANISTKLAKKIADFFNIEIGKLYTNKPIVLGSITKNIKISQFYKENEHNPKFFIIRRNEYSVASFIRNILLGDIFMEELHEVSAIKEYSLKKYKRELNSREISRELRRLYQKKLLERTDKFGNGSVYSYQIKKNK